MAAVACAGIAFAASGPNANATATQQSTLLLEVFYDADGDRYRMDAGGTVYEYDHGRWEAESDMKVEGSAVYEYDDGAWEGFFGRMKTEMYYGIKWRKASDLESAIDEYIDFYNNRRITAKLGGMTIAEHRDKLAEISKKAP